MDIAFLTILLVLRLDFHNLVCAHQVAFYGNAPCVQGQWRTADASRRLEPLIGMLRTFKHRGDCYNYDSAWLLILSYREQYVYSNKCFKEFIP